MVDDLSESHGPQESPLPDKRNRCSGYVQAGLNENRGHRLYIGFVKNRSPMKALTNHVVPSRSAQLLHFPMLFPSEFPARPSSSSSSPFFSIRLPPCFHRCKNRSEIFPFPPETVLSAVCEGTGNTRINRIWTKLRASLIMHSTWELPHFYSMEMLRDPVIRVFSLSLYRWFLEYFFLFFSANSGEEFLLIFPTSLSYCYLRMKMEMKKLLISRKVHFRLLIRREERRLKGKVFRSKR